MLLDKVTIALQNVFGRTLRTNNGRDHNANHHCSGFIGSGFKSAIVGGTTQVTNAYDFRAMGIDSTTGAANDAGDLPYPDTLASAGKTRGAALGVPEATLDAQSAKGKIIRPALTAI